MGVELDFPYLCLDGSHSTITTTEPPPRSGQSLALGTLPMSSQGCARLALGQGRATLISCRGRTGPTSKPAPEALARQTVTPVPFPFSMAWPRAAAIRWRTPPTPGWASPSLGPSFRSPSVLSRGVPKSRWPYECHVLSKESEKHAAERGTYR